MDLVVVIMVVLVGGAAIGWIPGVVAASRGHRNAGAIMACGLCGILFFPAWIAALVWAMTDDVQPRIKRARGRRGRRRVTRASVERSDAADALDDLAG
jgi:hypothetical protein